MSKPPCPSRFRFVSTEALVLALIFLHTLMQDASAQDKKYFFYQPLPYGSEATYNPLTMFLNGGFDVLQNYVSSKKLNEIPWNIGATSVWRSILTPLPLLNEYGWNNFLRHEVLPTSLEYRKAQFAPNYLLHLIGGGMQFRKVSEWYDYHGIPLPYVLGAMNTMAYHFLNELVENGDQIHPNVDVVADLLVFDPLGIVLFSFDGVADFFSTKLSLNDWSPQFSLSFHPLMAHNCGHSFVMKYAIVQSKKTSAFFYIGRTALFGITVKPNETDGISLGLGITQTNVYVVEETNGIPTSSIDVGFSMGIFYDRDNSLLASLLLSEDKLERVRFNMYPGLVSVAGLSPGVFFSIDGYGAVSGGITFRILPIGIAFWRP